MYFAVYKVLRFLFISFPIEQEYSLSVIDAMTSFLWNTAQLKDVADTPLIIKSVRNVGSCLNSVLKAGALIASGTFGSGFEERVMQVT